jgi:hypothetical protein
VENNQYNNIKHLVNFPHTVETEKVCVCWPEHCLKDETHGKCWCGPVVEEINGGLVIIHNKEN